MDGFVLIDRRGRLLEVNNTFCKMSGYSRHELLEMNITEIEIVESCENIVHKLIEVEKKGEDRFVRRLKSKGGNHFEVEISAQYQPFDNESFVCFIRDITEYKRLEDSLSKSLERLDLATNAAQIGIWDWDFRNNKMIWDDGMYSLYGLSKQEHENIYESWQKSIHPGDQKEVNDTISKACQEGGNFDIEFRILRPDGTVKYIKDIGKIFKTEEDEPVRLIGINYDITKNREMEIQLQQAQKMESIGTLAGGIAHDFNNILSPIMMHAEMAMIDLPSEHPLQNNMREIFNASERARDLVKQILTFARKRTEKRIPVKLSLILKEAIKFLRSTIPTTINIQYDIKSGRDMVLGDSTQLNQIIMNLCTNAAHAMREKGGLLEVIFSDEEIAFWNARRFINLKPGRYIKLSVRDNGTGIPPETIERIFEPYFTTKKTGEGTGLGLATVHGIVRNYGGDITVESRVGHGTTFNIYLPSIEADISDNQTEKTDIPKGSERVLLVDDEKTVVSVCHKMLERLGYKVTSVTNSIEALEIFRKNPDSFDIIITDMTMPNMTGDTLAKEIMAIKPGIPVILCTGYSEKINEEKAKKIGIESYVMKPIVMSELGKKVREVLSRKK